VLRNLLLHGFAQIQISCAIVTLASDLLAWMGMLALTPSTTRADGSRTAAPRLFTSPPRSARTARQTLLHTSDRAPWARACRRRDHPTRQPHILARLTPPTDCPDQPHHPDRWNRVGNRTAHPVTTTGHLSYPHDTINPKR